MSRSLRLAHLPSLRVHLRFSGYLTDPSVTDARLDNVLRTYLINLTLWRSRSKLPADWPSQDDTMILDPPAGRTPVWGEGYDASSATVIGDPETPWRLLVGQGQFVIENVWLYDPSADPWPTAMAANCPPCLQENVAPPSPAAAAQCNATSIGVLGALLGGVAGGVGVWLWRG